MRHVQAKPANFLSKEWLVQHCPVVGLGSAQDSLPVCHKASLLAASLCRGCGNEDDCVGRSGCSSEERWLSVEMPAASEHGRLLFAGFLETRKVLVLNDFFVASAQAKTRLQGGASTVKFSGLWPLAVVLCEQAGSQRAGKGSV